jgi:hypothetical protein
MFRELKNEMLTELNSERSTDFFFIDIGSKLFTIGRVVSFKPGIEMVKRVFERWNAKSFEK